VLEKAVETIGENPEPIVPVSVPALFIRGANSRYIREEDEAGIRLRFPHAQIASINGAGHWVQAEKPQEFAALVMDFFQSIENKPQ
jgi:pimeloyl-ACP methyl ester carboxylesterase